MQSEHIPLLFYCSTSFRFSHFPFRLSFFLCSLLYSIPSCMFFVEFANLFPVYFMQTNDIIIVKIRHEGVQLISYFLSSFIRQKRRPLAHRRLYIHKISSSPNIFNHWQRFHMNNKSAQNKFIKFPSVLLLHKNTLVDMSAAVCLCRFAVSSTVLKETGVTMTSKSINLVLYH